MQLLADHEFSPLGFWLILVLALVAPFVVALAAGLAAGRWTKVAFRNFGWATVAVIALALIVATIASGEGYWIFLIASIGLGFVIGAMITSGTGSSPSPVRFEGRRSCESTE